MSVALTDTVFRPYWGDTVIQPAACPALTKDLTCDLAIVGGGFTGLWTALMAHRRDPDARIVVLDAGTCGNAASGRNGGFCAPSISHGIGNALRRWPNEVERLVRFGRANLDEFALDLEKFGITSEFERSGKLTLAEKPWQMEGLEATAANCRRFGIDCELLDGEALQRYFKSPVYSRGLYEPNYALLNPGKLVAELRRVALSQGIGIHEYAPVLSIKRSASHLCLATDQASIFAKRAVLATNAALPLINRLKRAIIPVFDYALVTRPLSADELAATGWIGRHGIADSGNQFHYSRKTADNRILWGGYDAIYHYGSARGTELFTRQESFERLARNFARALPQLAHVSFTHGWGGIIDTSARTTFFAGTDFDGQLAYAMGFTGQGVSASRFAALAMLDLLDGAETERTRLAMLSSRPFPFPPEPLRSFTISLAQRGLKREDETGQRSLFLKGLDALRIGFDS